MGPVYSLKMFHHEISPSRDFPPHNSPLCPLDPLWHCEALKLRALWSLGCAAAQSVRCSGAAAAAWRIYDEINKYNKQIQHTYTVYMYKYMQHIEGEM